MRTTAPFPAWFMLAALRPCAPAEANFSGPCPRSFAPLRGLLDLSAPLSADLQFSPPLLLPRSSRRMGQPPSLTLPLLLVPSDICNRVA
ncbi:uncharacterized protein LAESUDRAFT_722816 [Laetiporus sulphureus 93-53]|uniref:Secreted protein n=1 Tax=Laetiporus sulphureus 93-53 TaxID=1314785 RepID=A0A165FKL5_9APHY|nr:uncharacterized protein LAESUDRAFT_722816 [Laetiporus sulphureus 93-53]KZT09114.1 hypothetical protein LAESUDRAFT_722816 [Laetiporus sulphureus 93-53]